MKFDTDLNLQPFNSFQFPCLAQQIYFIRNIEDLLELELHNKDYLVLGGGSNILLPEYLSKPVLKNELKGIQILEETEAYVIVQFASGEIWQDCVEWAVEKHFFGIENLTLIPGTIGAAPIQNIGAYGVEIKDCLLSVEYYQIKERRFYNVNNLDCHFSYRDSIFKKIKEFFITSVTLRLTKNSNFKLDYGDIKAELGDRIPTLKLIKEIISGIRKRKLPDPNEIGNAGSFFKNPIISKEQLQNLLLRWKDLPFYLQPDPNFVKIPAAWLIETAGLKGFLYKNCGVHKNQALVLVHYGNGQPQEIEELAQLIEEKIYTIFGISLEREVNIWK
jgi:UDP-N-acetylmuramate dehydrogenase